MDWTSSVLEFIYDMLFGCRHDRLTRPFTLNHETYKVCLDCGTHIDYSAERMEPLTALEARRIRNLHTGEVKIIPLSAHGPRLVPSSDSESDAAA